MTKAILLAVRDVSEIYVFQCFILWPLCDICRLILYCLQQSQQTTKSISRHRSLL